MSETLNVRLPDRLLAALDRVTAERMTSKSEYVRQAVLDKLRQDGVDPVHSQKQDEPA